MVVVFMGPPGAGKGTQAKLLARELKLPHVSTGDIYRGHIKAKDEIGRAVQAALDAGHFAPDETTNSLMNERLSERDCRGGYILDGFPRNIAQAIYFDTEMMVEPSLVINVSVPDAEVIARLLARSKEGRADDASEGLIRERIRVYNKVTRPLVRFYGDKGCLQNVDGVGAAEDVFNRIKEVVLGSNAL